jgi:anti-sigma B factor antagonist
MILRRSIEMPDSSPRGPDALEYEGCRAPRTEELAWLRVGIDTRADQAIVTLAGEVDIACATALGLRLFSLVEQGFVRIVVDLSGVEFCDAHGFGLLARVSWRAAQRGGWLRVAGARPRVARVIGIVRLTRTLPAYRTVSEALEGGTGRLWRDDHSS